MRIVSLLPSATEIVFALGLGDELVGRTHECDYPPEVAGGACDDSRRRRADLATTAARSTIGSRNALHGGSSVYRLDTEALAAAGPT